MLIPVLLTVLGATTKPVDKPAHQLSATFFETRLERMVSSTRAIRLTASPREQEIFPPSEEEVSECSHFDEARRALNGSADGGTLGSAGKDTTFFVEQLGHLPAAVQLIGPGGSGRFWEMTIAVQRDGRVVGACLTTSTVGFRQAQKVREFLPPQWQPLQGGRLVLWTSLGFGPSPAAQLLVPIAFKHVGDSLVVDRRATARLVSAFADAYAACQKQKRDPTHQPPDRTCQEVFLPAAAGFHAWAESARRGSRQP